MKNLVPVKVVNHIGTIEDNLEAVEFSIMQKVSEYSTMVFTEETQKDGKKFLAEIRKEKKLLDDERKIIKEEWMKPYHDFENRAKQIIALYDEPIEIIHNQLEEFKKKNQEMKKKAIQAIYESVKGEMEEWLPFERIYDKRWENTTYNEKKIREDMELLFTQVKLSISTIKSMRSEFEAEGLAKLKRTGSLSDAVEEMSFLQQMKEDKFAEEQVKQELNERARKAGVFEKEAVAQVESDKVIFTVHVPKDRMDVLVSLLQKNEFEYEVIV